MSTQDDALTAAFDVKSDPESEQASGDVDAETPQTEVEETTETKEEPTEENAESEAGVESSDDGRILSDQARTIVDNFAELSDEEKQEKLAKLESSGRKDQLEAAQAIKDVYGIETVKPTVDESKIDEIVEAKLAALGIDPKDIEKSKQAEQDRQRESIISQWALDNKADLNTVKNDKEFLKAFYRDDLQSLPLEHRTKMALYETYGNKGVQVKAKKAAAVLNTANAPQTGDPVETKEETNLFVLASKANAPRFN